ncbi:MAG: hypothetical protein HY905_28290 [Deltaproteobacteria bacterium]|nr:hypothetical protein [Deltaproteobacteria bacterium]
MTERLTYEEIEQRFVGEWVVVRDFVPDDAKMIRHGVVVAHTTDRAEAHRALYTFEGPFAIWWVGPLPGDYCGHLSFFTRNA